VESYLKAKFEEDEAPSGCSATKSFLKNLPAGSGLRPEAVPAALLTEQVEAYYDSKTRP